MGAAYSDSTTPSPRRGLRYVRGTAASAQACWVLCGNPAHVEVLAPEMRAGMDKKANRRRSVWILCKFRLSCSLNESWLLSILVDPASVERTYLLAAISVANHTPPGIYIRRALRRFDLQPARREQPLYRRRPACPPSRATDALRTLSPVYLAPHRP